MENYVIVYDTTLRDGEQAPGFKMNSEQKLEIAKSLEELNVDIIEAGFPGSSEGDFKSVNCISKKIKRPVISALARCVEKDIITAANALEPAIKKGKGKIHVFIGTSQIHRFKKLRKSQDEIINMAVKSIRKAKEYTDLVEFSPEDFARTDIGYTIRIVKSAVEAGANTINLPDTVGYRFPDEIKTMFEKVIKNVGKNVIYSVHAHNDLGLASANSLAALKGGARQVECTINGIGERAGNTALEEVVAAITEREDYFNFKTRINTKRIIPTSKLISRITGKNPQLNKSIVGKNAFRHSSGIHIHGMLKDRETYEWINPQKYGGKSEMPLTARSGKHQVEEILKNKKISYNPRDLEGIMSRFKKIADELDEVYDDSLVMAVRNQKTIPDYYKLVDFKTWFNKKGYSKIKVIIDEKKIEVIGKGNGMINAAENAINRITNLNLGIIDYSSKSLSVGGEARGIESVLVRNNGYCIRGIGISEDTVDGATRALIDASNRMRYVLESK